MELITILLAFIHPQPPTPIKTENYTEAGISNTNIK